MYIRNNIISPEIFWYFGQVLSGMKDLQANEHEQVRETEQAISAMKITGGLS